MKVVATIRGLIPRDQLTVATILIENDNALVVVTEWRVTAEGPDAPHVKRDAHAIMLATPEVQMQAASFGYVPGVMPKPVAPASVPTPAPGEDVTIGLQGQLIATEQAILE